MEHVSLYSQLVKSADKYYNNKLIVAYITLIKKSRSPLAVEQTKMKLFLMMGKLVVKAINNFNFLTKKVPKFKILHTNEDIAGECFLIYDKCLQNINMQYVKSFYFFLNTSLNRGIYRIFEKQYANHFPVIDNSDDNLYLLTNAGYVQHIDFSEVDLMNFTALELDVLNFKISGKGKLNAFLKEHDMQNATFHEAFNSIKEKLRVMYKDEHFFKLLEEDEA